MIELWSWPIPSGQQVHILLEETGLPYTATPVNTAAGEIDQAFLSLNPNYRIPAILDPQGPGGGVTLFETGAILIYLAEKAGNFIPFDPSDRYACLQWLMFQLTAIGPAFQNAADAARQSGPAAAESQNELKRLLGVLEARLAQDDYLAGTYSIADMAAYPWVAGVPQAIDLDAFPAISRWAQKLAGRPAIARGMALMQELTSPALPD